MPESSEKRYDPRMHTAEHVLNQTMVRLFGCGRSFSAHIERKKSKLDYHFDRPLRPEEVEAIEARVNRIVTDRLPVTEAVMDLDEAARLFDLDRLPEDAGDRIRIIRIGDYDACPCIGPHVDHTGEIGPVRIISTTFENGVLRLRYKLLPPNPSQGP